MGFTLYQSAESRRNRVIGLYETLLQRPDAGGLAYWAGQLATKSDLALASNLAASDEYFRRVP